LYKQCDKKCKFGNVIKTIYIHENIEK